MLYIKIHQNPWRIYIDLLINYYTYFQLRNNFSPSIEGIVPASNNQRPTETFLHQKSGKAPRNDKDVMI